MSDNDMKIYGESSGTNSAPNFSDALEAMNLHRANGNIDKAKQLGRRLAAMSPTGGSDGPALNLAEVLPKKFLVQDILYQIKVLMMFAAESLLEMEIDSPQLAATAINALYDSLSETSAGFYRNLSDGTAFSFYYLALKKGGQTAHNIGETFAMLCSVKKNTESYAEAGETVWKLAAAAIEQEIKNVTFENIY